MPRRLLAFALAALCPIAASAGCGPDPEPCRTGSGAYHIALPAAPDGASVVMFLHGFGGRASATIRNTRIVEPLLARGYAVIAPEGIPRLEGRPPSWNFIPGREGRDDRAFLKEVVADAAERFGVRPDRTLLSGFSAGGFMVTYIACLAPESFAAYAPVSGGFWRPHPQDCVGPVRLHHTHGWVDTTVPLEGRPLGGGAFLQGDIFAGLEIFRRANGCTMMRPDETMTDGPFWRRIWSACRPGSALEFALFPGGHTVPSGWADMAAAWFETVAQE